MGKAIGDRIQTHVVVHGLGVIMVGYIGDHADLQPMQRLVVMSSLAIVQLLVLMSVGMAMQMRPGQLAQGQQQA